MEIVQLEEVLNGLLDQPVEIHSKFCIRFGKLLLGDDLIGSSLPSCSLSSSVIQAFWPTTPDSVSPQCSIGEIQYFLEVSVTPVVRPPEVDLESSITRHTFAFVHWRKPHHQHFISDKIATICEILYQVRCKWNFLPVCRIANRCAHITVPFTFSANCTETVTIACPLPLRLNL